MERNNYVENYLNAYREMKAAAIEKMKNYGKELDVYAELDKLIVKDRGYKSVDEITDDDRDDFYWEHIYECIFEGKHETFYACRIVKVRYNEKDEDLEVYLEDANYDLREWFHLWSVGFGRDDVYMTVHKYL